MLSLVSAYGSPSDKVAWFALLRGPRCGLTLQQLQLVADRDNHPWRAICAICDDPPQQLDHHCVEKLRLLQSQFALAYQNRSAANWVDYLQQLALHIGLPGSIEHQLHVEVCELFFRVLRAVNQVGDVPNLDEFKRKLAELFVPAVAPVQGQRTAIQIMTMHKSKGLEFDVVFLPQLHRKKRSDDKPLIIIDKQSSLASEQQELFIAPIDQARNQNPIYQYLWDLARLRTQNEAARLLYVACTRAKKQLYLTAIVEQDEDGEHKKPANGCLLELLWPHLIHFDSVHYHQVGSQAVAELNSPFRSPSTEFTNRLSNLVKPLTLTAVAKQPEMASAEAGVQRQADPDVLQQEIEHGRRQAGILLHKVMELASLQPQLLADLCDQKQPEYWQSQLINVGVTEQLARQESQLITAAIEAMSSSENASWILDPKHTNSQREQSISYIDANGETQFVVVDRSFEVDKVRHIVDYKFSQPSADLEEFLNQEQNHYRGQLQQYKALLNLVEPMESKTYLYFPLIDYLLEVETPCL